MRLRPSIGLPSATGLYLGARELVAAHVALGPRGPRLRGVEREVVDDGNLAEVIGRWRAAGTLGRRVACGFDPRRLYAITRRLAAGESASAPEALLAAQLGLPEESVVAASSVVRLAGGQHAVLVACARDAAVKLDSALSAAGVPGARLLPVHWTLALRARQLGGRPRRWRSDIRILPGGERSLAILTCAGTAVGCWPFDLGESDPNKAAGLAVLRLVTHAREELGLPGVDGVLLHAGPDSAAMAAEIQETHHLPVRVAEPCAVDDAGCAESLARAALGNRFPGLDLFAVLRPPPGLRQNFPVRTAAAFLLAVGGMAFAFDSETSALARETRGLVKQAEANCKKARTSLKDLPKMHEKLAAEVGIAHAFLADRIFFSETLQRLPEVVPPSMTLVDFDGRDLVRYPSKKQGSSTSAKRFLTLTGEVPLAVADSSPPEVAELTARLASSAWFQEAFPRVTGANVRLLPAVKGLFARILITCLPASTGS